MIILSSITACTCRCTIHAMEHQCIHFISILIRHLLISTRLLARAVPMSRFMYMATFIWNSFPKTESIYSFKIEWWWWHMELEPNKTENFVSNGITCKSP